MEIAIYVLVTLAAIVLTLVVIVALQPDDFKVVRSATIVAKTDAAALDRLLPIIDRHADRLTLLIDDLLLLARLDSGRVELHLQPTLLRTAAQEALDEHTKLAFSRGARITPVRLGDRGPLIGAGAVAGRGIHRARRAARQPESAATD